ncbi:unannotated protein [freshwater metagenome]|uniref:Unannotated protein n=1 Tax=freshwater metagenome TaxID=449393 RepID=A0A6J5Z6P8_9ZZZZ
MARTIKSSARVFTNALPDFPNGVRTASTRTTVLDWLLDMSAPLSNRGTGHGEAFRLLVSKEKGYELGEDSSPSNSGASALSGTSRASVASNA